MKTLRLERYTEDEEYQVGTDVDPETGEETPIMGTRPVRKTRAVEKTLTAQEEADFEAARAPTLADIKRAIVAEMARRQDGGIVFSGLPLATDATAIAAMSGAKQKARTSRKIVQRKGGGVRTEMTQAQFDALFDVIDGYVQSVMDHASALLDQVEAAADPATVDISAGWPGNVIDA